MTVMNTTRTRIQTAFVIICSIAAVVAFVAWQKSRLRELAAENEQLRRAAGEVARLPEEPTRVRSNEVERAELERLRQWQAQTQPELMRLRGIAGGAQRANREADQLRAGLARQASEATNNPVTRATADVMKQGAEQRMEGRLSRMTASLHLTAEQAQAARDILMRQARMMSAAMQQGVSGKLDMKEISRQATEAGDPNEQIKALLTPDQQAAFPAYRQEEAAYNASLAANQELVQMQSTLGLTAEQTDRVYAALYEVSFNQLTHRTQPPSTNPGVLDDPLAQALAAQAEAMQWTVDQKANALESVLTPTQLENYRQQQALQAKLVKEMLDKMQGAGGPK